MTDLTIKAFTQDAYSGGELLVVTFMAVDYYSQPSNQIIAVVGTPANSTATPFPIFPDAASAIASLTAVQCADIISQVNTLASTTLYTTYHVELIDTAVGAALAALSSVAFSGSYTDLINKPSIPNGARTTSAFSLSFVGPGATGTQVHATKDSSVRIGVSDSTTATIGGTSTSICTLKKCATNSATESDWQVAGVVENDQTVSLAIILNSLQVVKGLLETDVPAGWYVKLENSGSGTHSESILFGEKTIFN